MSKLIILSISKTSEGVKALIDIDGNEEIVNVVISKAFHDYIVTDRIDAFVWGLLYFSMCKGYNIESQIPISEELYYNLEFHFIEGLSNVNDSLSRIHIIAPLCGKCVGSHHIVSTGVSCGVDSIYTIAQHQTAPDSFKLNTLAFFNAGSSFDGISDGLHAPILQGRLQNAQDFTKEAGLDFLYIESDLHFLIDKYLGYSHIENNTYMALFCIYQIQGTIDKYYYSSGYSYSEFTVNRSGHNKELDSEHYDLLILQMASINCMKFYSTGGNQIRFEKTRFISRYPLAEKYLNVCVNTPKNDGTCFKCVRTLLTLDALGVIDNYDKVFDIEQYHRNRKNYIMNMYVEAVFKGNSFYQEILPYYKKQLTPALKIAAIVRKVESVLRNRLHI